MRPLVVVPEELDGIFDTDDMYCKMVIGRHETHTQGVENRK